MKTTTKPEKKFDSVKFMREQRERVSEKIKNITPEQEIEYFKKKSEELKKLLSK